MNANQVCQALAICITAERPIMMHGDPGTAKSSLARATARAMGRVYIDQRITQMEAIDTRGLPYVENGRTRYALPAWLPTEPNHVVFFDEFPQGDVLVMNSLSEYILEGTLGGGQNHTRPANTGIILAGNLRSNKAGTHEMPTHIRNRLVHIQPTLDPEAWALGNMQGFPDPQINVPTPTSEDFIRAKALVSAYIRFRPTSLHIFGAAELTMNSFPTTRTWDFVQQLLPYIFDAPDLQLPIIEGCVGPGPAVEFTAFMRTVTKMPDINQCFAQPRTAPVPDRNAEGGPAILYALVTAMASRVDMKNRAAFWTYMGRVPQDFSVYAGRDIIARDAKLLQCPEGVEWAVKNAPAIAGVAAVAAP